MFAIIVKPDDSAPITYLSQRDDGLSGFESHEEAYESLPDVVRELIEDESESVFALDEVVAEIARTGDGSEFGFEIWVSEIVGIGR